MAQTSIAGEQSAGPADGLGAAMRLAAAALPVAAIAILVPDGPTFRVAARHGYPLDAALVDHVANVLRAAAREGAAPFRGTIPIGRLPAPFQVGAAVPLGCRDGHDLGLLLALAEGTSDARFTADQCDVLCDLARLATLHDIGDHAARSVRDTAALADALEALPEAIAIFDAEDRFVFWNRQFERVYASPGVPLRAGLRFEDHLRDNLARGHVVSARGREEAWLADRLGRFRAATGAHEHQLADGRWIRVQDRLLARGGRVGIRFDITHLVAREQSFRLLFDANPVPMIVIDREGLALVDANQAAVAFYGYPRETLLALKLPDIRPERSPGEIRAIIARLGDPALAQEARIHRTASGRDHTVKVHARVFDYAGRPAILAAIFDITEQQKAEAEVRRTRAFLNDIVDNVPTALFAKDMWNEGRYVVYNRVGEAMVGRPSSTIIGRTDRDVFDPVDAERFIAQDRVAMDLVSGKTVEEELIHRPDGTERLIRTQKVALADAQTNTPRYLLGIAEDITDQRASQARIAHMAHHDALTDLPNRFLLHDRLDSALARLHGTAELLALLCIDLDGFKIINDSWGHGTGDRLLCIVSERLREAVGVSDTAARLGGDEFVVLQAPLAQVQEAARLAARLVSLLSKPYALDGRELRVGASIGVAVAPRDGVGAAELLARADAALYQAKRGGRNRFRFADGGPGPTGGTAISPSGQDPRD